MKKVLISLAAGLAFFASTVAPASAATLTSAQVQAVVSLLQAFGVDATTIANVQNTLNGVQVSTPATTTASTTAPFTSNMIGFLRLGDKGDGVKLLQTMLAADPSVYPQGIISGFFGPMTAEALKLYQQKHGLERVGFIGPKTLHDLDDDLNQNQITTGNGNASSTVSIGGRQVCAIVPPGHLIAPGWLRHHEGEQLVIPTCQTLPPGIEDHHGNEGTTTPPTPDTTAPVISEISVGDLTASGATIGWTTNENATSVVSYGTTASYGGTVSNGATMSTDHSVTLSGLAASTLYHFSVTSTDASNNVATSSDQTFTTSAAPDTTPPVISAVSIGSIASTSASVSWTTDESATSKAYFSTSTPIDFTSAMTAVGSGLVTAHTLLLSPLATSTTYYYAVESQDASGNTATSSQNSFTTLSS